MKKSFFIPAVAVAGGAAAGLLRVWQLRTGFDAVTGLSQHTPALTALLVLLAALAVALVALTQKLPKDTPSDAPFAAYFATTGPTLATIPMTGVVLFGISGVWELAAAISVGAAPLAVVDAVLSLLMAVCLFPAVAACLRGSRAQAPSFRSELLLVPVLCLILRLVFLYRTVSIDPALSVYAIELLATVFLTMGFYRLSAFAVQIVQTRRFAQYASIAVVLCLTTLADGHTIPENLFYIGGALSMLGFLVLRLNAPAVPAASAAKPESSPNE